MGWTWVMHLLDTATETWLSVAVASWFTRRHMVASSWCSYVCAPVPWVNNENLQHEPSSWVGQGLWTKHMLHEHNSTTLLTIRREQAKHTLHELHLCWQHYPITQTPHSLYFFTILSVDLVATTPSACSTRSMHGWIILIRGSVTKPLCYAPGPTTCSDINYSYAGLAYCRHRWVIVRK